MKNVDIYMIESVSDGMGRKEAGYIYSVPEHIADELVKAGTAKVVNYPSLKAYEEAVEDITEQYKNKKEEIANNPRLTEEARAEDIEKLLEESKRKVAEIEDNYRQELDKLLAEAIKKAGEVEPKLDYDKDVVLVKVGHIRADIAMSSSFIEALGILQKALLVMEKNVATELLAQFVEVKRELDDLGQNIDSVHRSRYIREVYDNLKQKARDEKQAGALLEVEILNTLKKSGSISYTFNLATMYQ